MDEGIRQGAGSGTEVDVEELDESRIPTAPMRAVTLPGGAGLKPPIDLDDDDDEDMERMRPGTRDNPYTQTSHPKVELDPEISREILARQEQQTKPNMGKVMVRVLVLMAAIAAAGYGIFRLVTL